MDFDTLTAVDAPAPLEEDWESGLEQLNTLFIERDVPDTFTRITLVKQRPEVVLGMHRDGLIQLGEGCSLGIFWCIRKGLVRMLSFLLAQLPEADPNRRLPSLSTPLCYAISRREQGCVAILLSDPRTDPNLQGDFFISPITQAIRLPINRVGDKLNRRVIICRILEHPLSDILADGVFDEILSPDNSASAIVNSLRKMLIHAHLGNVAGLRAVTREIWDGSFLTRVPENARAFFTQEAATYRERTRDYLVEINKRYKIERIVRDDPQQDVTEEEK
jgi:hypothetical protein